MNIDVILHGNGIQYQHSLPLKFYIGISNVSQINSKSFEFK